MKPFKTIDAAIQFDRTGPKRNPFSFRVGFAKWTMLHGNLVGPEFVKVEFHVNMAFCRAVLTQGVLTMD